MCKEQDCGLPDQPPFAACGELFVDTILVLASAAVCASYFQTILQYEVFLYTEISHAGFILDGLDLLNI